MDPALTHAILRDRQIAYARLGPDLTVVEVQGDLKLLPPDCLGQSLFDLAPELIGNEAEVQAVLAGQQPRFALNWVNRETADGQTAYVHLVHLPHPSGLLHVVEDVTSLGQVQQALTQHRNELRLLRDRLEQQNLDLAAANTELRQLDELKSRFVSMAAHELRGPLSSISGYLELLLDEDSQSLTSDQRDYLQIIERGVGRLLTIINNLLDLTRIEAGRIELTLQPYDLTALTHWVLEECRPQLEARGIRLTVDTAPNVPSVWCDETRTTQIISNLLGNAIKYSYPHSTIEIRIGPAAEEGYIQFSVADHGVGIPLADQDRLFHRFYRASTASETGATGAGLGLYITRLLTELHGGRIWLESEPGRGSTFYTTFLSETS